MSKSIIPARLLKTLLVWLLPMFVGVLPASAASLLRAYGPGGPHHVLEECADRFEKQHGVAVKVIRARPDELARRIREDGDLYYGGAEYMMHDFDRRHPEVLDLASAAKLHPRRIGIIVRKGNPRNIQGLEDLQRDDLKLLDVKLERMQQFQGTEVGRNTNIRRFVFTGQEGVAAWRSAPELDAWVTYRSWHDLLEAEADFIEISGDAALRYTPVALTHRTEQREAALNFLAFLKSPEVREIFQNHGWD